MANTKLKIGLLCGGSGTRLWPFSRKSMPKQFHSFEENGKTLLENTINRALKLNAEVTLICTKDQELMAKSFCEEKGFNCSYLVEPAAKNTAAAISCFNQKCLLEDPNCTIVILPADHKIENTLSFNENIQKAVELAKTGNIVTLGIEAKFPSTAYGYIQLKEHTLVEKFIEKPSFEKASELINGKQKVAWNAGMFIFQAKTFSEKLKQFAPDFYNATKDLKKDLSNIDTVYSKTPEDSIDYALMEKLDTLHCIPADFDWSDLGSWEEVSNANHESQKNNFNIEAKNNHFLSLNLNNEKQVAFVGCSDLTVIQTEDAIVVLKKGHGQKIKDLTTKIKSDKPELFNEFKFFDRRPWGTYKVLFDTDYTKVKEITVLPGKRLSYQSHKHRGEQWTIVEGTAEVTLNDEIIIVKKGESIHIPLGAKHRISNMTDKIMKFVEVQMGDYFGEDDIIRYQDDFDRT